MIAAHEDPDLHGAGSQRNMASHLTAPLAAGAAEASLEIAADGRAEVGWRARHPLLLCAPRSNLGARGLRVTANLPGGGEVTLEFAPYTERGAALPLFLPATDGEGRADAFGVAITELREDGADAPLAGAEVGARLELRLVEGVLGRLIYAIGAEKQRIRRLGRELAAIRGLEAAHGDALDQLGAELGVPRLADELKLEGGEVVTQARREPDEEYRRRLDIYRPWLLPTRRRLLELLNGRGEGDNEGALGKMGLAARFELAEEDNPFAIAVRIVGAEDPAYRAGFLEFVRREHLVWPHPSADDLHEARSEAPGRARWVERVRGDLRAGFSLVAVGADAALAPMLAASLARVWRCRKALGASTKWPLRRAQDPAGGSRYELGLGADLELLPTAELDRMRDRHATRQPAADGEVEALLAEMEPLPAAEDPEGRWLLEPCGLRTVHRLDAGTQYVSHLPAFGLAVEGPAEVEPGGWTQIVAGDFAGGGAASGLLFYERSSGTGELYERDRSGELSLLRRHQGWRRTWTRIVAGEFGGAGSADLLFYERSSGTAELYANRGSGNLELLRRHTDWRRSWSEILAGRFSGARSRSDLLLYDRSRGEIEVHSIDGSGRLRQLGGTTRTRRGWTHLLAAALAGGPRTDLLFYDSASGTVELCATDGNGGLEPLCRHADWWPGFTHVLAGRFGGRERDDLLFYDLRSGRAAFYATDGEGRLSPLAEHSGWRRTWAQIVPGDRRAGGADLLFYERSSGEAELYDARPGGAIARVRGFRGWRHSEPETFEAHYHAPGDPGANVVLVEGIAAAAAAWGAPPRNGPAWTRLGDVEATAGWRAAAPPGAAALRVFAGAGLPPLADPGPVAERLERLPAELVATVSLAAPQAQEIVAGGPGATTALRELTELLRESRIASVLPMVTAAGEVLLVLGAIGLPEAGVNLQDRRSAGFRWHAMPIQGAGAEVTASGSRARFSAAGAGVYALVVVGYARTGRTDPYEFRVELPEGATLDLGQYELLMNALDHAHPAGVEVNTFSIRRGHVDLDGGGTPDPLTPAVSRTYRAYRRRRHRGEVGATLTEDGG